MYKSEKNLTFFRYCFIAYTYVLPTIMKKQIIIIITIFYGQLLIGQEFPMSFTNNKVKDEFPEIDAIVWDERVGEIELNSENEFTFYIRPYYVSCSTWYEIHGTWQLENDTILFSDQYEIVESDREFKFSNNQQNYFYNLKFKTDKNTKLVNHDIRIQFVYDYDSKLDDIDTILKLDDNFCLKIQYKEIPNRNKLASIRYEYFLPNGDKRYGYITENQTVNVKNEELPNIVEVTFIEKPQKEIIYRITKANIKSDKIRIISIKKTKSILLSDYTKELRFKEIYKKEK